MARPPAARAPHISIALAALLALAGGAALIASAARGDSRADEPPAQVPEPAAPAPEAGKEMAAPPAAAAGETPVTILYTIHNTGYIEPCG